MVAGRGRLQDQPVDGCKDKQLSNEGGHLIGSSRRVNGARA